MYAVIESGGKQYRVEPGDVIEIEMLAAEEAEGANASEAAPAADRSEPRAIRFERVLMTGGPDGVDLGRPLVAGAVVTAALLGEALGPKIRVFKTKRRNTQRRTRGHRQHLHRVRIEGIELPAAAAKAADRSKSHGA